MRRNCMRRLRRAWDFGLYGAQPESESGFFGFSSGSGVPGAMVATGGFFMVVDWACVDEKVGENAGRHTEVVEALDADSDDAIDRLHGVRVAAVGLYGGS